MADLWQFRRDSAANWTSANPVLADGEMGLESDTHKAKIGDGVTPWTGLLYADFGAGVVGPKGDPGAPGQIRFTGEGAPGTIVGANPNDTYLDLTTGDVYTLT